MSAEQVTQGLLTLVVLAIGWVLKILAANTRDTRDIAIKVNRFDVALFGEKGDNGMNGDMRAVRKTRHGLLNWVQAVRGWLEVASYRLNELAPDRQPLPQIPEYREDHP